MIKYRVVSEESEYQLANRVNKWIEDGWRPQGGVSVVYYGIGSTIWAQAMVKE